MESIDQITEASKATQEVAKATGKAIDTVRETDGFIARFIAAPLEQGIGIFQDRLRYMRWERQLRLMESATRKMQEIGLVEISRPVSMKIAIPIFQAASLEEDDSLQDRWVNLRVNAANKNSGIVVNRAFIEILGQITPLEAKILDVVYRLPFDEVQHEGVVTEALPDEATSAKDKKSECEDPTEEVKLAIGNLARVGVLKPGFTWGNGEDFKRVNPTVLGREFVAACRLQKL